MLGSALTLLFSTSVYRREFPVWLKVPITGYTALMSLWVIWAATISRIDMLALTVVFLCLMFVPSFLIVGATARSDPRLPSALDWLLSAASAACAVYFIINIPETATRISLFDRLSQQQMIFGTLLIALTLEITRRTVGLFLVLIVAIFIVYNLEGHRLTGVLSHGYISFGHFLDINIYTTDGLFGVPVRVAATYAFLFVLFGTFLERAKGGDFFFGLAAAISGRSPGGPAKVAVGSSAMFGTMSGSPTSDVVATGSITIPMMKRLGYKPSLAGGVEVAASTGGSLLPPVMGSAAFIMAELTGVGYGNIIVAALLPALLYYVGIYIQVHVRSVALNLAPLSEQDVPPLRTVMARGWHFLIPLVGLAVLLVMGYSPTMVAVFSAVAVWVVSQFRAHTRLGLMDTIGALSDTAIRMIGVTGACAAAGLVIGGITMTGLASKFSFIAFSMVGDNTVLVLILAAVVTIILGLGMPTPSAYVLAAVLIGPALVRDFEIPILAAHLFLLYLAVMSAMTPPVAVAAYAAGAIAQANPLAIAVTAMRLSVVAFVVPFAFVLDPEILTPLASLSAFWSAVTVTLGCVALAIAVEMKGASPPTRLARWGLFLGAACLLGPSDPFKLAGAVLAAACATVLMSEFRRLHPRSPAATPSE